MVNVVIVNLKYEFFKTHLFLVYNLTTIHRFGTGGESSYSQQSSNIQLDDRIDRITSQEFAFKKLALAIILKIHYD
jgi:hypothetical protein